MARNKLERPSRVALRRSTAAPVPSSGNTSRNNRNNASNMLVLILILIFITVSIISSVVYFNAVNDAKPKVLVNGGKAVGEVTLRILPPPEEAGEEAPPLSVTDAGGGFE